MIKETYERKKEEKKKKVVDKLQQDAAGAREAGMTYGQYMARQYCTGRGKRICRM